MSDAPSPAVPPEETPLSPVDAMNADLAKMTPEQLEIERRTSIDTIKTKYAGQLKDVPEELLQRLAFITGTLRRRASGPPKTAKAAGKKAKATMEDVLAGLED